jgi:hypothetical protein
MLTEKANQRDFIIGEEVADVVDLAKQLAVAAGSEEKWQDWVSPAAAVLTAREIKWFRRLLRKHFLNGGE